MGWPLAVYSGYNDTRLSAALAVHPGTTIYSCGCRVTANRDKHTVCSYEVLARRQPCARPPCLPLRCPVARWLQWLPCLPLSVQVLCLATTIHGYANNATYGHGTSTGSAEPMDVAIGSLAVARGMRRLAQHPEAEGRNQTQRALNGAKERAKGQDNLRARQSARPQPGPPKSSSRLHCPHMWSSVCSLPGRPMHPVRRQ